MNTEIVQQLRYKLQKRVRKLNSADSRTFHFIIKRYWQFLHNNEIIKSTLEKASMLDEDGKLKAELIAKGSKMHGATEEEEVYLAYWVIRYCVECCHSDFPERDVSHSYTHVMDSNTNLDLFREMFVEPLYEYIDEQLDDQRAILGLLRRYKHHCEWFRRDELLEICEDEKARSSEPGKKGRVEKKLALHLYEFLYTQGLTFSIEPWSISGAADLIAAQGSDDPLIADVKVFDPGSQKNKSYFLSGFHQVYQYTLDYNEPFGYMVIFKTCEEGLAFSTANQEQATSFVTFNGKTIFFVVIDLFAHEKSASKRGKLNSYIITEQELVTQKVESELPQAAPASPGSQDTTDDKGQA